MAVGTRWSDACGPLYTQSATCARTLQRHGLDPIDLRLPQWCDAVPIPKAAPPHHENLAAARRQRLPDNLVERCRLFPPPARKAPLAML